MTEPDATVEIAVEPIDDHERQRRWRLLLAAALAACTTKATARQVVAKVVAEVDRGVAQQMRAAASGALNRASRARRPTSSREVSGRRCRAGSGRS